MNKQTPQQRQYERRKGQPKITGLYISHEEKALMDAAVAISGGIKAAIFDGLRLVVAGQEKSSTWISVGDKLPDKDRLVIAIHKYDFGCEPDAVVCRFLNGGFTPYTDGLLAKNYDGGATIKLDMQITHWVPLPPQPEKGK